jgi:Putative Flp pilus-assembly TadE/G-like
MKLRFRNRKGQVAILMTFAVATLLGVMGLVSDVGVLYYSSIQLQKAADAAALAGANYFGPNHPPRRPAPGALPMLRMAHATTSSTTVSGKAISPISIPRRRALPAFRPAPKASRFSSSAPTFPCSSAAWLASLISRRLATRPRLGRCQSQL